MTSFGTFRSWNTILTFLVAGALLAGCLRNVPAVLPSPSGTDRDTRSTRSSAGIIPSLTSIPTSTRIPDPTQTDPATLPTPTASSTVVNTTVTAPPQSSQVISPDNAGDVVQLAVWGRGALRGTTLAGEGDVLVVQTSLGLYLYQRANLETIAFLAGVEDFLLAPDTRVLAGAFRDGTVELWQVEDGKSLVTLPYSLDESNAPSGGEFFFEAAPGEPLPGVRAMAFSGDGSALAVSYRDNRIGLWNTSNGERVHLMASNVAPAAFKLAFSPGGEFLATGGSAVAVWRLETGELQTRIPNAGDISEQPFSPSSERLVTADEGFVLVWKVSDGSLDQSFGTGLSWASAEFTPDGKHISVNSGEQVRRLSDGKQLTQPAINALQPPLPTQAAPFEADREALRTVGHYNSLFGVQFSGSESAFVWGADEQSLYWIDLFSDHVFQVDLPEALMNPAVLSPDGSSLVACTQSALWRVELVDQTQERLGACKASGYLAFAPQGDVLARASGTLVDLLRMPSGELEHNLQGSLLPVNVLAIDEDGELLAAGTDTQRGGAQILLWSLEPPAIQRRLNVPSFGVTNLAISPNKDVLASGGGDDKIRFWRISDGWMLKVEAVQGEVASMAFSPDGRLLAVGLWRGPVQILSVPDGALLASLEGHASAVSDIVFTSDGKALFTVSYDGTIRAWGLP
ncbi:MAG: WD40 repeat domain-containing protein [Anaerolineales bacterium]